MKWFFYRKVIGGVAVPLLQAGIGLIWLIGYNLFAGYLIRRREALLLAAVALLGWLLLTASAPAPAQACNLAVSGVQIRRVVEADRGGLLVPIGQIETSWSCTLAEAEAKAAALEAEVRQRAGVAAAPASAGLLDWLATVSGE